MECVGGVAARREIILRAARAAIEEFGPATLIGQVADLAGLARPNVYRHFPSKDALDRAVARSAHHEMLSVVHQQLCVSGTPLEVTRAPIAAQVSWADNHPNLYRFLVSREFHRFLVGGESGPSAQERAGARGYFAAEFTAAAARYVPRLADDPDAAEAVMLELAGLVDASILLWLARRTEARDQLIQRLTADVWLIFDNYLRTIGVRLDPALPVAPQRTGR